MTNADQRTAPHPDLFVVRCLALDGLRGADRIGHCVWMMRMLRLLCLLSVSAAACSGGSDASTGVTDAPASERTDPTTGEVLPALADTLVADGVRLWVRLPSDEELAAPVEGALRYDKDDDCFLLERNGISYPVVWPADTTAESSGPTVVSSVGDRIALGQYVVGSGGYLDIAVTLGIPAECVPATQEVAVFNANSTLSIKP